MNPLETASGPLQYETVETIDVIVPLRNESKYLTALLDQLKNQTFRPNTIYLVVGPSIDDTLETATRISALDPMFVVLKNPEGTAAHAMNLGLASSTGDAWIRIDGHTEIPSNLIEILREELNSRNVACVGPLLRPGSKSDVQAAIGIAMSSGLGVGGAKFRTGLGSPGPVDALAFGLYRSSETRKVGTFNETMLRNQDDEFNTRLRNLGGTLWLTHRVEVTYYPRDSYQALSRQYYQYGYWRIIGTIVFGNQLRFRQVAPSALVMGLVAAGATAVVTRKAALFSIPLSIYLLLPAALGISTLRKYKRMGLAVRTSAAIPILHSSYGLGSIKALLDVARSCLVPSKIKEQYDPIRVGVEHKRNTREF